MGTALLCLLSILVVLTVARIVTSAPSAPSPTIPIEFKQFRELLDDQQNVLPFKNVMECIRKSGLKLLLLEDEQMDSSRLQAIGIQPAEMVLETALTAQQNASIQSFIVSAPTNLAAVYGCVQKYAPTTDKEACCKENKSIPTECTQLCSGHVNITALDTRCALHFNALKKCYPTVKSIPFWEDLGKFGCKTSGNCIRVVNTGIYIGGVSALTDNPVGAGIGFGVAGGAAVTCGVAAGLC